MIPVLTDRQVLERVVESYRARAPFQEPNVRDAFLRRQAECLRLLADENLWEGDTFHADGGPLVVTEVLAELDATIH